MIVASRKRTCKASGKVKFNDAVEAGRILDRMRRIGKMPERAGRAYLCEHGDHWHITSKGGAG